MICLARITLLFVGIFLNRYTIQALTYGCNRTAPCGCSKNDVIINTRIVGGEFAYNLNWGWAASLHMGHIGYFCGGSIVSSKHILTAARCVSNINLATMTLTVIVSSNYLYSEPRIAVSRIYVHPNYKGSTSENDIAILELSDSISFEDGIRSKLCLPISIDFTASEFPLPYSTLVAIGWGNTGTDNIHSFYLKQVALQVLDAREYRCRIMIFNTTLQFCAGVLGGGKDTCYDDAGGPLMYYSEMKRSWIIAGITSYGRECGSGNYASVFTRVSVHNDWIRSIIQDPLDESHAKMINLSRVLLLTLLLFLLISRSI